MDDQNDNLVIFPKTNPRIKINTTPFTQDELEENIRKVNIGYYDIISDQVLDTMMHQLQVLGFAPDHENYKEFCEYLKQIAFLREVLIGIMCSSQDYEHPMHDIIKEEYVTSQTTDENTGSTFHSYKFKESADE